MNGSRVLGDYTLIKQIGQGALGAVFLAEHRFMKKQFALKVFPDDLSQDRGFIQRFEEEVCQLSILEHPHIVKLHNISYDQGSYFLVSDCIVDKLRETTNLGQYLQSRDTKLSEEEVVRLLQQLAGALDYAHNIKGKGLSHRGIKLNNILVSQSKEGIQLFLSDFGLSKIVGHGTLLTRMIKTIAESLGIEKNLAGGGGLEMENLAPLHTSFLQSFAFLAPEQKSSPKASVDGKADVFAFGILAYFLLMDEFPEAYFDMPNKRHKNLMLNWDELVKSCLQKNPAKRPSNLTLLLEGIRSFGTAVSYNQTASSLMNNPHVPSESAQTRQEDGQIIVDEGGREALRPVLQTAQLERPKHDADPAAVFTIDPTVKHYTPEQKEEKFIQPLLTDMVVVKGGNFYRGSTDGNRDEMPRHQITLNSFAIDIHPVTNEQFVRFLEAMGGVKDMNHNDIIRLKDSRINSSKGKFSIESGYIKHPVVGVTWYGAVAYAKWVGKRLPSEAEWEISSCGGIDNILYPTGEDIEKSQANFFSFDTTAVMSYPPNGYGLYDMAGNVYEWCQDWYGYNYYESSFQEPLNPSGPLQGVYRVLKGGCWKSLKEDLRCSRRNRNNPGTVNSTYGFRCAADVR